MEDSYLHQPLLKDGLFQSSVHPLKWQTSREQFRPTNKIGQQSLLNQGTIMQLPVNRYQRNNFLNNNENWHKRIQVPIQKESSLETKNDDRTKNK